MGLLSTKWAVVVACSVILVLYPTPFTFTYLVGGAFSGIIAKILKYLFNEQRPTDVSSDPGMPSSHSMNLFYLASYLCMPGLSICGDGTQIAMCSSGIRGAVMLLASALSIVRISSGHHTIEQICAGALFGVVWAFIWSREASFRLERWLHDAFAYGGASSPQILALCLVAAAVLVTGPVERLWKGAFKTAKANEHKEKPVS